MLLVLEGCNGVGKTTLIEQLLHTPGMDVYGRTFKFFSIKNMLQMYYPDLYDALAKRQTFELSKQQIGQLANAHVDFIDMCQAECDREQLVGVMDRSIASYYVYQACRDLSEQGMLYYKTLLKEYESRIKTVYLKPAIEIVRERLMKRNDADHLMKELPTIYDQYAYYFDYEYTGDLLELMNHSMQHSLDSIRQFLKTPA